MISKRAARCSSLATTISNKDIKLMAILGGNSQFFKFLQEKLKKSLDKWRKIWFNIRCHCIKRNLAVKQHASG